MTGGPAPSRPQVKGLISPTAPLEACHEPEPQPPVRSPPRPNEDATFHWVPRVPVSRGRPSPPEGYLPRHDRPRAVSPSCRLDGDGQPRALKRPLDLSVLSRRRPYGSSTDPGPSRGLPGCLASFHVGTLQCGSSSGTPGQGGLEPQGGHLREPRSFAEGPGMGLSGWDGIGGRSEAPCGAGPRLGRDPRGTGERRISPLGSPSLSM
jgi:hypothetical protein